MSELNTLFPTRFAEPSDSPGFQLWRATCRWQRKMRNALEPVGLTHVQFVLLAVTGWREAATPGNVGATVTQQDVADAAGTDKTMTSQVLRTLEKKQLITRSPHPTDSRAIQLCLTDEGRQRIAEALIRVEAADAAFFTLIGEEKSAELAAMLHELAEYGG